MRQVQFNVTVYDCGKPYRQLLMMVVAAVMSFSGPGIAQTPDAQNEGDKEALVQDLRLAIESAEIESGPFATALREPLEGLADQLFEAGEYSDALQHYGRLLHISRINDGLYSNTQSPIVEKIIDGNLLLQDWQSLDDSQEYLFFLAQRTHAKNDPELLQNLQRHIDWKLAYIGLSDKRNKSDVLIDLEHYTDSAIVLQKEQAPEDKLGLAKVYYQRALLHYYYIVAVDDTQATGKELAYRSAGFGPSALDQAIDPLSKPRSRLNGSSSFIPDNGTLYRIIRTQRAKGNRMLEAIVELFSKTEEPQQRAMALVYQGDWYFLTDQRNKGIKAYQQAYSLLSEANLNAGDIDKLFSVPQALPVVKPTFLPDEMKTSVVANQNHESDRVQLSDHYAWSKSLPSVQFPLGNLVDSQSINNENYVDAEFTVRVATKNIATPSMNDLRSPAMRRASGNITKLDIVETKTADGKTRWQALDDLKLMVFRPRVVNGSPMETEARMRYFFSPDQ